MGTRNIPMDEAGPHVEDVMLRAPRTFAPETTVGEARATFENPRVRLLLVARGDTFLGAVTRDVDPRPAPTGDPPLEAFTGDGRRSGRAGRPGRAGGRAARRACDRPAPVVADDGEIVGLVCFNRRHGHFCVDG